MVQNANAMCIGDVHMNSVDFNLEDSSMPRYTASWAN